MLKTFEDFENAIQRLLDNFNVDEGEGSSEADITVVRDAVRALKDVDGSGSGANEDAAELIRRAIKRLSAL